MLNESANPYSLPIDLPAPIDDGACVHLASMRIPEVSLHTTDGRLVNIANLLVDSNVLYFYPCTGVPGKDPASNWDSIPGAPGCTVQSCGFRDKFIEFQRRGIAVFGISTQCSKEQKEFAERNQIPFPLLSDKLFSV